MLNLGAIQRRFSAIAPFVDERSRRLFAAAEALVIGPTGMSEVARATGVSREAIRTGLLERNGLTPAMPSGRIRRPGGGRTSVSFHDPDVLQALALLVEPTTRGDPESPLRWTCKSTRTLAAESQRLGHQISHTQVAQALHALPYSLHANRKSREREGPPDRDAEFQ